MTEQRFKEICKEEGLTGEKAEFLWAGKPERIKEAELNEESIRRIIHLMYGELDDNSKPTRPQSNT